MTPLYEAAAKGDVDAVRRLLEEGTEVDQSAERTRYETALGVAAANGHPVVVDILLKANANVDAGLDKRGSALLHAYSAGHIEIVKALMAAGADIHSAQPQPLLQPKKTPLHLACANGETAIAELLLDAGVEVEAPPPTNVRFDLPNSPLYEAVLEGYPETVRMLLTRGANVNGYWNSTPLYAATCCLLVDYTGRGPVPGLWGRHKEEVRDELFQLLVDAGANMDDVGAFHEAASGNQIGIVRKFIDAGIDVNNARYGTAIAAAAAHGHLEMVTMLLQVGADVNEASEDEPHALLAATYAGDEAIVQLLLDAGAKTNCRFNEHQDFTPLQLAADQGQARIVSMLLAAGASVDDEEREHDPDESADEDEEGNHVTALLLAVRRNDVSIISMLLEAGADVNAYGGIVLKAATNHCSEQIVQMLLREGAFY